MLRYEPLRGSHAVQEAVFYVQFAPIPTTAFGIITTQTAEIEAILPTKSDIRVMQISLGPNNAQSFTDTVGGVEFKNASADGAPAWLMRFSSDNLSVHCLDYSRYDTVWDQARSLLMMALARVPSDHAISGLGLRYIDRFRFRPDLGEYDSSVLFKLPNRYLSPRSFDAGSRWHCHNGWFAEVLGVGPDEGFVAESLNQLNVTSSEEVMPAGSTTMITIDHNLIVRPLALGNFSVNELQREKLDHIMLALHKDNKRTMSQLLTDAVCRRLSLNPENRG